MSRAAPPSVDELRAIFDELILNPPEDGSSVPTGTGLDGETVNAIERAWAGGSEALATAARHEFELQLDGTHIREAKVRERAIFEREHSTQ